MKYIFCDMNFSKITWKGVDATNLATKLPYMQVSELNLTSVVKICIQKSAV